MSGGVSQTVFPWHKSTAFLKSVTIDKVQLLSLSHACAEGLILLFLLHSHAAHIYRRYSLKADVTAGVIAS